MNSFRIIDLRPDVIVPEVTAKASTPEAAAMLALGLELHRSGAKRDLVCRVYWVDDGKTNMVRLYSKAVQR